LQINNFVLSFQTNGEGYTTLAYLYTDQGDFWTTTDVVDLMGWGDPSEGETQGPPESFTIAGGFTAFSGGFVYSSSFRSYTAETSSPNSLIESYFATPSAGTTDITWSTVTPATTTSTGVYGTIHTEINQVGLPGSSGHMYVDVFVMLSTHTTIVQLKYNDVTGSWAGPFTIV